MRWRWPYRGSRLGMAGVTEPGGTPGFRNTARQSIPPLPARPESRKAASALTHPAPTTGALPQQTPEFVLIIQTVTLQQ